MYTYSTFPLNVVGRFDTVINISSPGTKHVRVRWSVCTSHHHSRNKRERRWSGRWSNLSIYSGDEADTELSELVC